MFVYILIFWAGLSIDANETGIFSNHYFVKTGDGFVLYETAGNNIVAIDEKGNVIGAYRKAGQGPDELQYPYFFSTCGDTISFVSHRNRILKFSNDLSRMVHLEKLNAPFGQKIFLYGMPGFQDCQSKLWLVAGGASLHPHILNGLEKENGSWRVKSQFFPQPKSHLKPGLKSWLERSRINIHKDRIFFSKESVSGEDDFYRVDVFQLPSSQISEPKLLMSLAADVSEFPVFRYDKSVYMYEGFKIKDGYIVTLKVKPGSSKETVTIFDEFSESGDFLQRRVMDTAYSICLNCDKTLFLRTVGDREVWSEEMPDFPRY